MKQAKNSDEANEIVNQHNGDSHGWIQWKGTDVCMDVHCLCGYHSHVDAEFAYHIQCPQCKRIYLASPYVEFVLLEKEPKWVVTAQKDILDE